MKSSSRGISPRLSLNENEFNLTRNVRGEDIPANPSPTLQVIVATCRLNPANSSHQTDCLKHPFRWQGEIVTVKIPSLARY